MDARTVRNDCVSTLSLYNIGLSEQEVKDRYAITTVVKLGSNENPYGPSKTVGAALAQSLTDQEHVAFFISSISAVLQGQQCKR